LAKNQEHLSWHTAAIGAIMTLLALSLTGVAHSQSQELSIATESGSYAAGDTIVVSGSIPTEQEVTHAVVQIISPDNEALSTFVPAPDSLGEYTFEVATDGWQISGTYVVRISHGDEDRETTFAFVGLNSQPPAENLSSAFSDGTSQNVDATLTNGVITRVTAVEEAATLIFSLSTTSADGEFRVVLPRALIDSREEPDEDGVEDENNFLVLVDGDYIDYNEIASTDAERTLVIPVVAGTEEVLIGGSSMVPEFPLVVIGAAAALAGLLALTRAKVTVH
jgi:hypothetical protein